MHIEQEKLPISDSINQILAENTKKLANTTKTFNHSFSQTSRMKIFYNITIYQLNIYQQPKNVKKKHTNI